MFRSHFHVNRFLPTNQKKKRIRTLLAASNIQKRPGTARGDYLGTLEIYCHNKRLVRIHVRNLLRCIELFARMFMFASVYSKDSTYVKHG